ncbi:hypothetical protein [Clostridium sp. FP1]|uniref:hypothetical protein n=1 Tax=Clostridium sp. FP1 TaxID=2724076 RepID=UPI0013E9102E|nr:hypothetical protein [Clostridium sp. FP1]MBZ9635513.1 hypothetical protein [Clostridium sp. FP1]
MNNILKKICFLRSKSIEEIANDKKSYKSVKDNYINAYRIYKSKMDDSEFIKNKPEFIKNEKIKLKKIIEEKIMEINYTSVYITVIALAITIATTYLISIPGDAFSKMKFILTYLVLVIIILTSYEMVKIKNRKEISNSRICLTALEDIEKEEPKNSRERENKNDSATITAKEKLHEYSEKRHDKKK